MSDSLCVLKGPLHYDCEASVWIQSISVSLVNPSRITPESKTDSNVVLRRPGSVRLVFVCFLPRSDKQTPVVGASLSPHPSVYSAFYFRSSLAHWVIGWGFHGNRSLSPVWVKGSSLKVWARTPPPTPHRLLREGPAAPTARRVGNAVQTPQNSKVCVCARRSEVKVGGGWLTRRDTDVDLPDGERDSALNTQWQMRPADTKGTGVMAAPQFMSVTPPLKYVKQENP